MRVRCKYKGYNHLVQPFSQFPLRVLKFKNTKWKKLQKSLSLSSNVKKFNENLSIKVPYKMWDKVSNYYKEGNRLKNVIFYLYDKSVSSSYLKNVLKNSSSKIRNMYLFTLLKPEFRLDILLWKANFFSSSYQARQYINNGDILVNKKSILGNFFLSKGDVISFSEKFNPLLINPKKLRVRNTIADLILTFVEIDYYTNTIVVIKDLNQLTVYDFYLLLMESYNLKKIKDCI
jgi:ribosomal protein S4